MPDDLPFRHYSLKHRAIAWISRCLFDRTTYTVRHGLIRGLRRKGGLGWVPEFIARGAQTKEEMFWLGLPLAGMVIYDVGAYPRHSDDVLRVALRTGHLLRAERNQPCASDGKHLPEQSDQRRRSANSAWVLSPARARCATVRRWRAGERWTRT